MIQKKQHPFVALFALLLSAALAPSSQANEVRVDEIWSDNMAASIETAQKEHQDMILLFTGSDWCPPCQKLEKETLGQADFLAGVRDGWVLVKFDFLRNSPLSKELEQQNEKWSEHYGVAAFPTLVLVDEQQRPFGFLGYQEGGPVTMLESLRDLKERRAMRDNALAQAEKAEGDQRAAFLDQALTALDPTVVEVWYTDIVEEIVKLDEDNHLGLREKWYGARDAEARQIIFADIRAVSRLARPEQAISFIDEVLEAVEFPVQERFEILKIKLGLLQQAGNEAGALDLLDSMLGMPEISDATRQRLIVKKALQYFSSGRVQEATGLLEASMGEKGNFFVRLTLAQILAKSDQTDRAIALLNEAIPQASNEPDALVELVAALADLQSRSIGDDAALDTLEQFANNEQVPVDLRAEALLQAAMIMRESGRVRPATLTENRAVALAKTPELARELQRVVDALRSRVDDSGN